MRQRCPTCSPAGIGVGILTVPLVASVAEDAMSSVPNGLREASAGLGARRITTSLRIVFPAAVSGIVAALILAISRAIGETMVVLIAAGADQAQFTASPFQPSLTMTAAMASLAGGSDAVVGQGNAYQSLFFVGFLLFLVTLVLNVLADPHRPPGGSSTRGPSMSTIALPTVLDRGTAEQRPRRHLKGSGRPARHAVPHRAARWACCSPSSSSPCCWARC